MESPPENPPFRARSSFSLGTALLLTALVAMAVVIWQFYAELSPLRAELGRLRAEVGALSIDDRNRIYVVAVDADLDQHTWKWRVYLPKNQTYTMNVATARIPATGELSPNCTTTMNGGTYLVTVGLQKQSDGKWAVVTRCKSTDDGAQQVTFGSTCGINPTSDWLEKGRGVQTSSDVGRGQVDFDPSQSVELMRLRAMAFTPTHPDSTDPIHEHVGTSTPVVGPADGFAIWIEAEPLSAAAGQASTTP